MSEMDKIKIFIKNTSLKYNKKVIFKSINIDTVNK